MNISFAYVVLHYQDINTTKNCVDHFLELSEASKIVIVDNFSQNGSGVKLKQLYEDNSRVEVLINDKNLGFAIGNNIGYKHAKDNYRTDYIVVSNNDVIVSQKTFEIEMASFMSENVLDVCGPDIITLEGTHQNPLLRYPLSTKQLKNEVRRNKLMMLFFRFPPFYSIYKIYRTRHKIVIGDENPDLNNCFNCILHGSFMVFGKRYIENENAAFLPVTFMYGEEMILFDYLQYKGYKIGVSPNTTILHLGGKSTNMQYNFRNKTIFRFQNTTLSLEKQIEYRKLYGK